jgi:preprotein translocase subunit SecD
VRREHTDLVGRRRHAVGERVHVTSLRPVVLLLAAALVLGGCGSGGGSDTAGGGSRLSYRVLAGDPGAGPQVAAILRARLRAAGIGGARVTATGGRVEISAAARHRAAIEALTVPGRLAIFDWEPRVLGPRGVPAPSDPRVTGGAVAGGGAVALSRDDALRRARTSPGRATTLVRAEGGSARRWYVLSGAPALTNAGVASARDEQDPISRDPLVALTFTRRGRDAFMRLTRTVAHRGRAAQRDAASPTEANQHFVIVLDGRILATPFLDFRQSPDGVDAAHGAQISGGLTALVARRTAAILGSGPLPARLKRVS